MGENAEIEGNTFRKSVHINTPMKTIYVSRTGSSTEVPLSCKLTLLTSTTPENNFQATDTNSENGQARPDNNYYCRRLHFMCNRKPTYIDLPNKLKTMLFSLVN
jgi:hypothetical protein